MPSGNTLGDMATIKGIYGFYTIRIIQGHFVVSSVSDSVKAILEYIIAFIGVSIAAANKRAFSGHYMISLSKHRALLYRVSLLAFMQCSPKRKVFNRNAYALPQEALSPAVSYWYTAITNSLRDFS